MTHTKKTDNPVPPSVEHEDHAAGSVLDRTPPSLVFQRHLELRRLLSVGLLGLLSVVLLTVSFAPFDCWYLAYFALVPWALAMAGGVHRRRTIFLGWFSGLIFWAFNLYWLTLPTVPGYVAGVLYLSLYWLAASLLVRAAMKRNWPMWITLPILWVALEFVRGHVISFTWFYLAQTQYAQLPVIQIADIAGEYGVSFFVAMVNGLLIDLLSAPLFSRVTGGAKLARQMLWGIIATILITVAILGYGHWRLGQKTTSQGPKFGIVQEAFPISLAGRPESPEKIFEYHLQRSFDFIGRNCNAVTWPETMLSPGMNRQLLETDILKLDEASVRSLAGRFWNPLSVRQCSVGQLRNELLAKIGPDGIAYRVSAARYLLNRFVTPTQLARLDIAKIRRLGKIIFGPANAQLVDDATLHAALGMYAKDYKADLLPEKVQAGCVKLFERRALAPGVKPLEVIRQRIARQIAVDEKIIKFRRGQVCLMETASLMLGCPILAGGTSVNRNPRPTGPDDIWVIRNSVLWFDSDGWGREYSKVHLVPFSEYVPCKYSWPWLHGILRKFVPEAMPQVEPGTELTAFGLPVGKRNYQLVTPICFEGTFGRLCRKMVNRGRKNNMILVNFSNDGWFVYRGSDGLYHGTTEHTQHLVHYVFRAVENRVPVVRAVNTGISGWINSDGKIESLLEIPGEEYRKRTMVAGSLLVEVRVDNRHSPYSRCGDIFAQVVSLVAAVLVVVILRKKIGRDRGINR
ncbi:MAG: hypothetical protein K8S55_15405 [Phycisphaerae bacterium]|nr:hypothetical protein [Phycisphaerae bacterium]